MGMDPYELKATLVSLSWGLSSWYANREMGFDPFKPFWRTDKRDRF